MLLLIAGLTRAQQSSARAATAWLDVVALGSNGTRITDLRQDEMILREDGEPREIHRFGRPDEPWNILLLFEHHNVTWLRAGDNVNGDLPLEESWGRLLQAVGRFTAELKASDRIAIGAFREKTQTLLDWHSASDPRAKPVVLPPLERSDSRKNFYGAIDWAVSRLKSVNGRKAVIVFSDGRDARLDPQWLQNDERIYVLDPLFGVPDSGEAAEFVKTVEAVRQSGIRFFFLVVNGDDPKVGPFGTISDIFPGSRKGISSYVGLVKQRLAQIADASGGAVINMRTPADAIAQYARLYRDLELAHRYTIEYSSSRGGEGSLSLEARGRSDLLRSFISRSMKSW
jgi:hypothetical protein